MTEKQLKKFCSLDNRRWLEPWSKGEYTYACGYAILVRIPRMDSISELENDMPKDAEGIIAKTHTQQCEYHTVSGYNSPLTVKCDMCDGKGKDIDCPECDGYGEVYFENDYNNYEFVCESCDGSKRVDICPECKGTGQDVPPSERTDFHGFDFDARLLTLLSGLPNCKLGLLNDKGANPFIFDGGIGAIMPMIKW